MSIPNGSLPNHIIPPRPQLGAVIDQAIEDAQLIQHYHFPDTATTVCCIKLSNGFTVIGQSSCLNPDEFDKHMGEAIAFEDAKEKLAPIFAHSLRGMYAR